MAIKQVMNFVDEDTQEVVEMISCACGNSVFYVTTQDDKVCSCCGMKYESQSEE